MKVLLRLTPYIRQHIWAFTFGIIGLLGARVFEALIPLYVKMGIDSIVDAQAANTSGNPLSAESLAIAQSSLTYPAMAICACVIAQMIVTIISRILIRRIGIYAAFDIRNQMYRHMQLQGPAFFSKFSIGDLMARAINDVALIRQFLAGTTRLTTVLIFTAVVGLGFMFSLSVELALIVIIPLPLIAMVAWIYSKHIYRQSHTVQQGFSRLSTFVQENLNGIRTVQAMAQEDDEVRRFGLVNDEFARDNQVLFITNSQLSAWMPILAASGTMIIIGYGSFLVAENEITLGTFAAFFSYLALLLWPVREAGSMVTQWQRGSSGTQRVFEVLDYEPEIRDDANENFPELTGKVSVRNLYYQYVDKDKYALEDINFDVEPGETIAILGRVGSGKSTLLRLFVRLIDPVKGDILLDGHPISGFPLDFLRQHVCLVLQDPFLFADSLSDNIAYDQPDRDLDDIWESADAAALRETIENFPDGLQTILGERGVTLSGGQKQRTALARGLVRMTPLLILDDCFSAVDTETEEHILSGLKSVRADLTTLLVSHRVSTARHADRIIVLDEGKIVEMGSHNDLLQRNGFYADLEKAQRVKGSMMDSLQAEDAE
ncbi:MAG: ATP-binding cassette subfamily B protein [Candidatus Azotimanducaceae bacterium]|jgi:ATP-binding cassette subfamily B protein